MKTLPSAILASSVLFVQLSGAAAATDWIVAYKISSEDFGNNSGEVTATTSSYVAILTVSPEHVGRDLRAETKLWERGLTCSSSGTLVDSDSDWTFITSGGGDEALAVASTGDCCKPSGYFLYYDSDHKAEFWEYEDVWELLSNVVYEGIRRLGSWASLHRRI